jgi:hypothetical protein
MSLFQGYRIFVSLSLSIILIVAPGWLGPVLASGSGTGSSKIRGDDQRGPYPVLIATAPTSPTIGQMSGWVRVAETIERR